MKKNRSVLLYLNILGTVTFASCLVRILYLLEIQGQQKHDVVFTIITQGKRIIV